MVYFYRKMITSSVVWQAKTVSKNSMSWFLFYHSSLQTMMLLIIWSLTHHDFNHLLLHLMLWNVHTSLIFFLEKLKKKVSQFLSSEFPVPSHLSDLNSNNLLCEIVGFGECSYYLIYIKRLFKYDPPLLSYTHWNREITFGECVHNGIKFIY